MASELPDELPEECCAKCRFYRRWGNNPMACHRYPPVLTPGEISVHLDDDAAWCVETSTEYPEPPESDWCGEFQPVKPPTPTP